MEKEGDKFSVEDILNAVDLIEYAINNDDSLDGEEKLELGSFFDKAIDKIEEIVVNSSNAQTQLDIINKANSSGKITKDR